MPASAPQLGRAFLLHYPRREDRKGNITGWGEGPLVQGLKPCCVCVSGCMCVLMYVQEQGFTCMYVRVEARRQPYKLFFSYHKPVFFESGYLTGLELSRRARPGDQQALESHTDCGSPLRYKVPKS